MLMNNVFDAVAAHLGDEGRLRREKAEWAIILTWEDREGKARAREVLYEHCRADEVEARAVAAMRQVAAHSVTVAANCGYQAWDEEEAEEAPGGPEGPKPEWPRVARPRREPQEVTLVMPDGTEEPFTPRASAAAGEDAGPKSAYEVFTDNVDSRTVDSMTSYARPNGLSARASEVFEELMSCGGYYGPETGVYVDAWTGDHDDPTIMFYEITPAALAPGVLAEGYGYVTDWVVEKGESLGADVGYIAATSKDDPAFLDAVLNLACYIADSRPDSWLDVTNVGREGDPAKTASFLLALASV